MEAGFAAPAAQPGTAYVPFILAALEDPAFAGLDFGWFPHLQVLYDGRNSLRSVALPDGVAYQGVGVPAPARRTAVAR